MRSRLREGNALFVESANAVGIVAGDDPVRRIVMQLGALGYRQSELIVGLAERPEYLAQIMQLVRGLLEAWWRAAWLTRPKVDADRTMRAVGLLQEDVVQREEKIGYQNPIVEVDPDEIAQLETRRAELEKLTEQYGCTGVPSVRQGMEGLDRPGRYAIYRWESDAAHASLTGLGLLTVEVDGINMIGGAGDLRTLAARLSTTWMTAIDLYEIVRQLLGMDISGWETYRANAEDDIHTALHSLD